MKKQIYIIALFLLTAALAIYVFLIRMPINSSAYFYNALPQNGAMIIKINEPLTFFKKTDENSMLKSLIEFDATKFLDSSAKTISEVIKNNELAQPIFKENPLAISLYENNENGITALAIISLNEKAKFDIFEKAILNYCSTKKIAINRSKQNKAIVLKLQNTDWATNSATIAYYKGLLFFCNDYAYIEDAIQQLNTDYQCDPQFLSLLKTASSQTDLNVFVNHSTIHQLFADDGSPHIKQNSQLLNNFTQWSELDIQLTDNSFLAGGFSQSNEDKSFYGNILKNQEPLESNIDQIVPSSTLSFLAYNFSDVSKFFSDYTAHLKALNLVEQRNRELKAIQLSISTDISMLFQDILDKETAVCTIPIDNDSIGLANIWLVKAKSGSQAFEKISEIQKTYLTAKKIAPSEWVKKYEIDSQTSYSILKFPFPQLPGLLFGNLFSQVNAKWVTLSDNYLVFGDSFEGVAQFVKANTLHQTLVSNNDYQKFQANLSRKSNINFYCNISESGEIAHRILNNTNATIFNKSTELKKFRNLAWQISASGGMLYNNGILDYNPEIKIKSRTVWQAKLATELKMKPQFVRNPSDPQNKDLLFQDESNALYLINNISRPLWQIQLDEKIFGEIIPIDYFNNGKIQFLFNTENKIYLIDREGNNIQNFPINLRSKATNGVSIFDYDNNKNYRFFIACSDKNIYAFDEKGKILDGWNNFRTDHIVTQPLQHLRVEGKDYIVASDQMKDYFLNRKGVIRIESTAIFPHSPNNTIYLEEQTKANANRFVTTDDAGKLHYTYLDGKHEEVSFCNVSTSHFFIADDLDASPGREYVFADAETISVFNAKGEQIFSKTFESPITYMPSIVQIGKSKMVGVTLSLENNIYLLNMSGEIQKGFPFEGCSPFAISPSENDGFNIAVGAKDGYLNYYFFD